MKRFVILGLVVLTVVLAWSGAWLFFADQIRRQVDALAIAQGPDGTQLTCGRLSVAGFPFRFDVDCVEATLLTGDVMVTVPELRVSALAYRPQHLLASARGPAEVSDAFTGARNRLSWQGLEASLRLAGFSRIERFSAVGTGLTWTDTLWGEALIAASPRAELHLIDMPEHHDAEAGVAGLAGYAEAGAVEAPGLAVADGDVSLEIEVTGLPDTLVRLAEPDALRAWQQAGGVLKLVSLDGREGEKFVHSEGELALNAAGQVDGQLTLRSRGLVEQIAPLFPEAYGDLLLGTPEADGSYSQTLNIRGGVILSGLLPAGMVPPLF